MYLIKQCPTVTLFSKVTPLRGWGVVSQVCCYQISWYCPFYSYTSDYLYTIEWQLKWWNCRCQLMAQPVKVLLACHLSVQPTCLLWAVIVITKAWLILACTAKYGSFCQNNVLVKISIQQLFGQQQGILKQKAGAKVFTVKSLPGKEGQPGLYPTCRQCINLAHSKFIKMPTMPIVNLKLHSRIRTSTPVFILHCSANQSNTWKKTEL